MAALDEIPSTVSPGNPIDSAFSRLMRAARASPMKLPLKNYRLLPGGDLPSGTDSGQTYCIRFANPSAFGLWTATISWCRISLGCDLESATKIIRSVAAFDENNKKERGMLKELMSAGGTGILIPATVFLFMMYAIKGLYGLVGHASRHRRDFLGMWDSDRAGDDLWLEVSVRHHFGTYLPATIIRLALAQPDKSQSLIELCEIWSLLSYDREAQTVKWLHQRHENLAMRRSGRYVLLGGYFVLGFAALGYGVAAFKYGPHSFYGWGFAFTAVAAAVWACIVLLRDDTIRVAVSVGDEWVRRINQNSQGLMRQSHPGGSRSGESRNDGSRDRESPNGQNDNA